MARGVLVGRETEVEQLRAAMGVALRGQGRMITIEGEPGVGKSALLEFVTDECARLRMTVRAGAAEEIDQKVPFAAIFSCLDVDGAPGARAAWIASLLGDDAGSTAVVNPEFAVIEAVLDLIERDCAAGPVALVLDDLQWADQPTFEVLHRLGLSIAQLPLLVVVALRHVPRRAEVERILRSLDVRGAIPITLNPLDDTEVANLVERLAGAPPGPGLRAVVAGAAGNPLYTSEVVAALGRDGRIALVDGVAELVDAAPAVPASLSGAILRRLDFLSFRARDVLQMAAVLGPALTLSELSVILHSPASELTSVVRDAVAAGLLIGVGEHLTFRHELIRDAMARQLPATVRGALHVQAAHALARTGGRVDRVAQHLLAGDAVHAWVPDWLTSCAEALVAQAPALAADLIDRTLAGLPDDDPRGPVLRQQQVRALLWTRRPAEAEAVARVAVAGNRDPGRAGSLRWLLAQACFQQGHVQHAYDVAAETLSVVRLTPAEFGRFQQFVAECRLVTGQVDLAHEEAAAEALLARGDPESAPYALYHLSGVRFVQERMAESLELLERALAAFGARAPVPEWNTPTDVYLGSLLLELDRCAEADKAFETGLRRAERHGSPFLTWHHMGKARLRFFDGRWDDALAEIEAGLESMDTLGEVQGLNTERGLRRQAALIAIRRGDRAAVATVANSPFLPGRGEFGDATGFLALWAQALAWEAQGNPKPALTSLLEAWHAAAGIRQQTGLYHLCPDTARLAVTLGEPDLARPLVDDLRAMVDRQPTPTLSGIHDLCRGLVDADPEPLAHAATLFAAADRPLYQAQANENVAAVLARQGHVDDARAALRSARELYGQLDAAWDAARAQARLREAGVRSRAPSGTRRPKSGWGSLTDTELRVAELVARGHSNPEVAAQLFISRRTVQSHVSSIMAKLNCASRVEVAVAATSRHAPA